MNDETPDELERVVKKFLSDLPVDAIQVFVRGFHDRQTGDRIVAALHNLGFNVREAIGGSSDDLGGIIETEITAVGQLESDNLQEIKDEIYQAANDLGVFCQWAQYHKIEDSMVKGI